MWNGIITMMESHNSKIYLVVHVLASVGFWDSRSFRTGSKSAT
ncbi:unnamed protein product [Acanthoscelides obtectus]|uniref:Uncharacterized protein n=1 Tax=Acanthoscelides obtectus TaxID=200917 RepID=A0A9P0PTI0_ACAOB|nr:unnamed protein product [Acanthoscelides obtectus]CAK1663618.1 hypothetical protein AOBTE_LOCUS23751 [Acanthoscelides obtectus]